MSHTAPDAERESARLELLYQISRQLSRRLELPDLLPAVLRITAESVGATNGSLIILDANGRIENSCLLYNGRLIEKANEQLAAVIKNGLAGWAVRNRKSVLLANAEDDPRWVAPNGAASETKAVIAAPLQTRERVVGVLTISHSLPGYFGEDDLSLLTAIGDLAVIAVENARLFEDSRRQMQVMAALADTARDVVSTLDLDEVLHHLLHRTVHVLGVEAASIALVNADRGEIEFKVAEGAGAQDVVGLRLPLGQGVAGWVAQSGKPVLVPEVRGDPRFYSDIDRQTGFTTRSIMCAPIPVKQRTIGVIEVMNPKDGAFDQADLQLLTSIAGMAGSAISHAQLFMEIQAAEARYAGLFEDSTDPIIITDLAGQITDANRKALEVLGYRRDELIDMPIRQVHRSGGLGTEPFRNLASGKEVSFQTSALAKDGREIPVEVHAKLIERGGQQVLQWIERDISERLAVEEMRNDLTSMIFHDLRSPLGNIISSLDVLEAALPPNDEALQSVLSIAIRASQRLSRLVDSLLDLRRLESGKAILQRAEASINAIVAEAAEQVHPVAESKGITLRFDMPPRLPLVNIDADMIRRVLINLMENAVKYSDAEDVITVSARADGKRLTLSVRDTGPGIAASDQARIFDKFARATRQGAPKGLGLGLAFCQLAVEAHGGTIGVESQPGKGATFTFTLPL